MYNEYFFRNDDIRESLDESLVAIQNIFIDRGIPITQAVEPANISHKVVDWLLSMKKQFPQLITIMQHGYDHTIKNKRQYGEFGGDRTYSEQYEDISNGKELMDAYFKDQWFPAFNFPCAPYNKAAIKALNDLSYKVLNSHFNIDWKRRIFYFAGHILRKGLLFNHHVSWNMQKYPGTSMYEISMNISFIKRYINEKTDCEFFTYEALCSEIDKYFVSPYPVGLLLHHRYHITQESIDLISRVLDYLDKRKAVSVSMKTLYKGLVKKNGNT